LKCEWQPQIAKEITKNPYFGVHCHRYHVGSPGKLVRSACYDAQHAVLLLDWTTVAETARFEGVTQI